MKPPRQSPDNGADLFRARLENMINLKHELVLLAEAIEWRFFDETFEACYEEGGRP